MTNNLTNPSGLPLLETGWYWAAADLNKPGNDFVFNDAGDGFKIIGRQAHMGEFVVATCELSDLLTQPGETLTSLSISFNAVGQSDIGFSAWIWDGTKATTLIAETKSLNVGNGVVNEFKVEDLSLGSDKTILFLWNESSGGETNTISSLTSSYTSATVPEPTTATLSLLALAGLAARRRRK